MKRSAPTRRTLMAGAAALAAGPARAAGETLLVLEKGEGALAFHDLATGARVARVPLPGAFPHEFALDPAGRKAYVAHYGLKASTDPGPGGSAVFVVDLAARAVVRTIDCEPYGRLHGIRADAEGRVHVLSEADDVLLTVEEPAEAAAPGRVLRTGTRKSHLFALSRDGGRAYVSGILSNTVALVRPFAPEAEPVLLAAGEWPEGSALSPDERTLLVAYRGSRTLVAAEAGDLAVRASVPSRGEVVRLAALPDGRIVTANLSERSLSLLRPDLTEIGVVALDAAPQSVSLHPRRAIAYAALDANRIAVVDLDRLRVEGHVETGEGPDVTAVLAG